MEFEPIPTVLTLGLKPHHIEVIERVLKDKPDLQLVQLSPLDTDSKLVEGVQQAAVIFIYWEGLQGPTYSTIRRIRSQTSVANGRIHMIYDTPQSRGEKSKKSLPSDNSPLAILDQRQSKTLGIASWIRFPDRHIEIERILFQHHPEVSLSNLADHSLNSLTPLATQPANELPEISDIPPRDLLGLVEEALNRRMKANHSGAPQKPSSLQQKEPWTFDHLAVFHFDQDRAREIAKLIEGETARSVTAISHPNELLACLMRGVDGLAFWFDGHTPETPKLLRQIAENPSIPSVPTALLVPDKDALLQIKSQLSDTFFDIVVIYQRMRIALNESLKTLESSKNQPDTPRGILERLRRPMRLCAPPEFQRTATLQVAETLCQRLGMKPGKASWAPIEIIPYLIREGLISDAIDKVNAIRQNLPQSFIGDLLDYQVTLATKNHPLATAKVKEILSRQSLNPSQRLQLGQVVGIQGSKPDLLMVLNSWQDQSHWREEPEFYFLGGQYLSLTKHPQTASYFAKAVYLDPMRVDYIAAYGEHLAAIHEHPYGIRFLRTIVHSDLCHWRTKITLIKSLIEDRQFKEARVLLDQMMLEAPGNKDLTHLGQSLQLSA